jgi:hypothetical protein
MTIELWQIAQARRALDAFCSQHQLVLDEVTALRASDHLLLATRKDIDDPEQLYDDLRRSVLESIEHARRRA